MVLFVTKLIVKYSKTIVRQLKIIFKINGFLRFTPPIKYAAATKQE
jgi:hypothetical protein